MGNRFDEQRLTLRIHRGRGSSGKRHQGSPHSNGSNSTTTTGSVSPSPSSRSKHERVKISVSYPSSENLSPYPSNPHLLSVTPTSPTQPSYAVHYSINGKDLSRKDNHLRVQRLNSRRRASRRSSSCDSVAGERAPSPSPSACEEGSHKSKVTVLLSRLVFFKHSSFVGDVSPHG